LRKKEAVLVPVTLVAQIFGIEIDKVPKIKTLLSPTLTTLLKLIKLLLFIMLLKG
jgi:hypothetical protein